MIAPVPSLANSTGWKTLAHVLQLEKINVNVNVEAHTHTHIYIYTESWHVLNKFQIRCSFMYIYIYICLIIYTHIMYMCVYVLQCCCIRWWDYMRLKVFWSHLLATPTSQGYRAKRHGPRNGGLWVLFRSTWWRTKDGPWCFSFGAWERSLIVFIDEPLGREMRGDILGYGVCLSEKIPSSPVTIVFSASCYQSRRKWTR